MEMAELYLNRRINKKKPTWYIYIIEYYCAIKNSEVLKFTEKWIHRETRKKYI